MLDFTFWLPNFDIDYVTQMVKIKFGAYKSGATLWCHTLWHHESLVPQMPHFGAFFPIFPFWRPNFDIVFFCFLCLSKG